MLSRERFRQLFDECFDALRSYIYYRCGNAEWASDVAQDVFMRLWEKRAHLDDDNLKALLYKMASEQFVSQWRRQAVQSSWEQDMVATDDVVMDTPEKKLEFKELKTKYAHALEGMPEGQREVFLMSRNDGLKYHEIAECLSLSVKAVEKRMSAALLLLRKEILS